MSKNTMNKRQSTIDDNNKMGLVQKVCGTFVEKRASDFAQPIVDITFPTVFKRGLEVFNTYTRIQKLRAEATPDTPDWQVVIAGIAGTGASTATALPLEAALTYATTEFMLSTGPVGATAVGFWYGGTLCTLNLSEKVGDSVEQAVVTLDTAGMWDYVKSLASSNQDTAKIYHHAPITDTQTSRLNLEKSPDSTKVIYESVTNVETTTQEIADAVLLQKQTGTQGTFFDTSPKIIASLPDGDHIAYVGTAGPDNLDASSLVEPVEIYAGNGGDTLIGGMGNDYHVSGKGNDQMQDASGYDRYFFTYDEGHDTIEDTDRLGEIVFNAFPVSGVAREDINNPGMRWVLDRDDASFILTRTNGVDLTITVDEAIEGAQNSITIKNFPFDTGVGLRITLGVQPTVYSSYSLVSDGSRTVNDNGGYIYKIDQHRFVQAWNTPSGIQGNAFINSQGNTLQITNSFLIGNHTLHSLVVDKNEDMLLSSTINGGNYKLTRFTLDGVAIDSTDLPYQTEAMEYFPEHDTVAILSSSKLSLLKANGGYALLNEVTLTSDLGPYPYNAGKVIKLDNDRLLHVDTQYYSTPSGLKTHLIGNAFSASDLTSLSGDIVLGDDTFGRPYAVTPLVPPHSDYGDVMAVYRPNVYSTDPQSQIFRLNACRMDSQSYTIEECHQLSLSPSIHPQADSDSMDITPNKGGYYTVSLHETADNTIYSNTYNPDNSLASTEPIGFSTRSYQYGGHIRSIGLDQNQEKKVVLSWSNLTEAGLRPYPSDIYDQVISFQDNIPSHITTNGPDSATLSTDNSYINTLKGADTVRVESRNNEVHVGRDNDPDIATVVKHEDTSSPLDYVDSFSDFDEEDKLQLEGYSGDFMDESEIPYGPYGNNGTTLYLPDRTLTFSNLPYQNLNLNLLPDAGPNINSGGHGANNAALGALVLLGLPLAVLGGVAYYYREPIKEKSSQAWNWLSSTAKSCWDYVGMGLNVAQDQQQDTAFELQEPVEIIVEGGEKEENALPPVVETVTKKTPTLPEKKPVVLKSAPPLPEKLSSLKSIDLQQHNQNLDVELLSTNTGGSEEQRLKSEINLLQQEIGVLEKQEEQWQQRIPKSASMDFSELAAATKRQGNDNLPRSASFSELLNRKQEFMSQQL